MKLITSPTTPFGRKVRIVLLEKKIPFELVNDIPWNADTQVGTFNPLGKVPVLVLKDGETLFDSRVIVEYLEHVSPVGHLLPQDPSSRIRVRKIEALADGVTDAAALVFLEFKRPESQQSRDWMLRQQGKVFKGLEALSETLGEGQLFLGNKLTLADIAAGCCLGYLDFRFPDIKWRDAHANLAAFYEKVGARPSFRETIPAA
ncbi:glutathione S-transferase [Betaproteobacteria bacterium SCN2]|jgi:glutathione S-transferase|nr:glutathione S-transferase [Betaproteobacteria bacterium SCN2]